MARGEKNEANVSKSQNKIIFSGNFRKKMSKKCDIGPHYFFA